MSDTINISGTAIHLIPEIGVDAFAVYCYLQYHSRASGNPNECTQSYDQLQIGTGLRRERISNALKRLEGFCLILRSRRFAGATIYILNPSREDME